MYSFPKVTYASQLLPSPPHHLSPYISIHKPFVTHPLIHNGNPSILFSLISLLLLLILILIINSSAIHQLIHSLCSPCSVYTYQLIVSHLTHTTYHPVFYCFLLFLSFPLLFHPFISLSFHSFKSTLLHPNIHLPAHNLITALPRALKPLSAHRSSSTSAARDNPCRPCPPPAASTTKASSTASRSSCSPPSSARP